MGRDSLFTGYFYDNRYELCSGTMHRAFSAYKDMVDFLGVIGSQFTAVFQVHKFLFRESEPFVSTALAAGKEGVAEVFDMNTLWKDATGQELPMGVLVARKAFAEEKADDLKVLLNDLQSSVDFVNGSPAEAAQLIVEKGFIGKAEIAEAAIPNCHIVLYAGDKASEGAEILKIFNQTLFEMNPQAVGGKLPADDLYYAE